MRDGVQIFDLEIPLLSKSVSKDSNYLPSLRHRVRQQQRPFFLHPEPRVSLLRHGSSAPQLHPSFLDTAADSCLLLDGVKESAGRQERQIPRPPSWTPHRFVRRGERDPSLRRAGLSSVTVLAEEALSGWPGGPGVLHFRGGWVR